MLFCPTCANILIISAEASGYNKWACQTCPYEFPISKQMTSRTRLQRKEVDDVLGGDAMWKDVDQTDIACPKCDNGRAYFMQLQIRSADEPMTTCEVSPLYMILHLNFDNLFQTVYSLQMRQLPMWPSMESGLVHHLTAASNTFLKHPATHVQ